MPNRLSESERVCLCREEWVQQLLDPSCTEHTYAHRFWVSPECPDHWASYLRLMQEIAQVRLENGE
jgi:hypothetical protein